jgi:hypothetical protein
MSLELRVASLERANRRWKIGAALALVGGAGLLLLQQGALQPPVAAQEKGDFTLTAQKLVLKSKNGNEVFVIDANWPGNDGAFVLKDPTGRHRMSFGIAKESGLTYMNFWDNDGKWVKAVGEEQMP